jgi:hypothetical protein
MQQIDEQCKIIYKDYSEKIKDKLPKDFDIQPNDINNLITILNFCFQRKNNFFIKNFNKRVIRNIYVSYNQIKTNILTPSINNLFEQIEIDNIKLLRFIIINFINNYEINDIDENKDLYSYISKESIKRCLNYLNNVL